MYVRRMLIMSKFMNRPKTYIQDFICVVQKIQIRAGDNIGRQVEQFVFNNLIELKLKIQPSSCDEFFHMYLPNSQESSWAIISKLHI
jgi:hypothetical protein